MSTLTVDEAKAFLAHHMDVDLSAFTIEEAKAWLAKVGEAYDIATSKPPSFVCPRCGAESYNPNDIRERYCGRCHVFVDDAL